MAGARQIWGHAQAYGLLAVRALRIALYVAVIWVTYAIASTGPEPGCYMASYWDGSEWTDVSIDTGTELLGIWGTAPDDVWAVGSAGTVLHWDGNQWSSIDSGVRSHLYGVFGTTNYVLVVGEGGNILRRQR